MFGTVLTASQLFRCLTSTATFSNESAERVDCFLLCGKTEAVEALAKITGFSSGVNNPSKDIQENFPKEFPQNVSEAAVCADARDLSLRGSPTPKFKFHIPASVRESAAFNALGFSVDLEDLLKEFPRDSFDTTIIKRPKNSEVHMMKGGYIYKGEWDDVNGQPEGVGEELFSNGDSYFGNFHRGERNGFGVYHCKSVNGRFEGLFKEGLRHGFGFCLFPNNDRHFGYYKLDKRDGKGCFIFSNGEVYFGLYSNNHPHGKGFHRLHNGSFYAGEYDSEDGFEGKGFCEFPNGETYDGDWQGMRMTGHGKYCYPDGVCYNGDFEMDQWQGKGRLTFPAAVDAGRGGGGDTWFDGKWTNGNGIGKFHSAMFWRWARFKERTFVEWLGMPRFKRLNSNLEIHGPTAAATAAATTATAAEAATAATAAATTATAAEAATAATATAATAAEAAEAAENPPALSASCSPHHEASSSSVSSNPRSSIWPKLSFRRRKKERKKE